MRKELALVLVLAATPATANAWGFAGHRMIEEEAIELVPAPLRDWLRAHRTEISDWSLEPDTVLKERYGREETEHHFIDLDLYGRPPFAELPHDYDAAVAKFGKAKVDERGTVPWTIEEKHAQLVRQLRAGEWQEALRTAAYGGHYVADATMPLHTTADYDGKQSGHPGIHQAVERAVVDERIDEYRRRVRAAVRPARLSYGRDRIFDALFESYASLPELMNADREARRRGDVSSREYVDTLDRLARPLLVRRMARAVELLAAFWTSAWEEAGRPLPAERR